MPLTDEQRRILEECQKRLPRFLFRGFNSRSGGGNPHLNNHMGVIPHGFNGTGLRPTTIDDIPNLVEMIDDHLTGRHTPSCFSSWVADLDVALEYSGRSVDSWVAIIDTNLLADHVKIHHVPAFHHADLAGDGYHQEYLSYDMYHPGYLEYDMYDHEYLAYGPIEGPAYHCVKYMDITFPQLNLNRELYRIWWYSSSPLFFVSVEQTLDMISTAERTAFLFRRADDTRPDVVIALTAFLMAHCCVSARDSDIVHLAGIMFRHFSPMLGNLEWPPQKLGLVNQETYVTSYLKLEIAVRILTLIEGWLPT
ncbi:hypothetical protein F4677DRAFT_440442 [Hypoxylon crocopeplum]|nr:hypothetical protein F4677DRAFT_440442 [Hypoxylon crocopeplum]